MKYRELKAEAIREAEGFKEHATPKQKKLLEIGFEKEFNPKQAPQCWYGLATGSCYSPEAAKLMNKIRPTFIMVLHDDREDGMTDKEYALAGEGEIRNIYNNHASRELTALEWYIMIVNQETVRRNLLKIAVA